MTNDECSEEVAYDFMFLNYYESTKVYESSLDVMRIFKEENYSLFKQFLNSKCFIPYILNELYDDLRINPLEAYSFYDMVIYSKRLNVSILDNKVYNFLKLKYPDDIQDVLKESCEIILALLFREAYKMKFELSDYISMITGDSKWKI